MSPNLRRLLEIRSSTFFEMLRSLRIASQVIGPSKSSCPSWQGSGYLKHIKGPKAGSAMLVAVLGHDLACVGGVSPEKLRKQTKEFLEMENLMFSCNVGRKVCTRFN